MTQEREKTLGELRKRLRAREIMERKKGRFIEAGRTELELRKVKKELQDYWERKV